MTTFAEKLKRARRPRRTVEICLAGDLVDEFERLGKKLLEAQQKQTASASIEDSGEVVEIAEQMEALRPQIRELTEPFVIEAISGTKYRTLKQKYPPHEGEDGQIIDQDKALNVHVDDFAEPLIRACLVEPQFSDELWAETLEAITDGQWDELFHAAILVNEGRLTVPFSPVASAIVQSNSSE
ncbi:hypothetical protein [Actinoplanes teichomyceticus]|uniref:Uncharacterized protein n=1 Tax=Actinoplanes teichomyceticus TaxID=1867 RepID=A0A561WAT1_ACTTI|nr:hypothetical protein [Actinoplanes teichomyceticus]TWG20963.1 hypothetical protein FHX34_103492 [Actinoplanes teichomyceticus]GIF14782.1 hypothetical protein Ate01nite_48140 [Actinoplanes teichomyceticus]